MRIAVVENEPEDRRLICSYIEDYFQKKAIPADLQQYENGEQIAEAAKEAFDVIFMDIDMKGLNGLEAARHIRSYDSQVMIVFITHMANYAIEGYSVQALDFLVKPVSVLRMREELDKILHLLKKRNPEKIILKVNDSIYQIDIRDIYYIEMYGRKIRIHRSQGILEINSTLRYFEELLSEASFYRCHNAFLVNMVHVSAIEKHDIVIHGERIPVSRQRKKGFAQAFARYLGGCL